MSDTFNAADTAEKLRHEVTAEFHNSAWPKSQVFDQIFDEISKDPAKFNAVVAAMEKQNATSHDGLIVKDQKTQLGNVDQVILEYHVKPDDPHVFRSPDGKPGDEVATVVAAPTAAVERGKDDWNKYKAAEEKQQADLSFSVGSKSLDELTEEVQAKIKVALHDPHSLTIGRNESLENSFRKLDPGTFTLLAGRLDRENSYWSSNAQVKVFPSSNGFPASLEFHVGTFDFQKPVDFHQTYWGPTNTVAKASDK